jgi:predicted nucleotidyltransferase
MTSSDRRHSLSLHELRERRSEILDCAQKRGAFNVRVFGSVARGEQKDGSDVDFLVEFEDHRSLLDHGGLLMDLQELLGCEVDVVHADGMRKRFRDHVLQEAVPL